MRACLLMLLVAASARGAAPAVLVDRKLQRQPVMLQALGPGGVSYFDAQRQLRVAPAERFVRVELPEQATATTAESRPAEEADADATPGVLELMDGTALPGKLTAVAEDGQGFTWEHPALGAAAVSLDDVVAVGLRGRADRAAAPPPGTDRLVFLNNDRIDGFLEKLTAIKPEGGALVEAPLANVAAVYVANPRPSLAEVKGDVIHLRDGGRVVARGAAVEGDVLSFEMQGATWSGRRTLPLAAVAAVDLGGSGLRRVEVGDLEWRLSRQANVFGLQWPVRVAADRVDLHAPGELTVTLPAGTVRAAATAALEGAGGAGVEARGAGDPGLVEDDKTRRGGSGGDESGGEGVMGVGALAEVEVVVSIAGREVARAKLDAAQPAASLNVDATAGGEWVIRVDEGDLGPILDRVTLTGAAVLVKLGEGQGQ